jgi:hypothetical protein
MGPRIRLAISLIVLAAAVAAADARAQNAATVTTTGTTSISAPGSISVTQNLSFTVLPRLLATSGLTITSSALNGVNTYVQLTGDQETSVSIPDTFEVRRVGGDETITVRTVGPPTRMTGFAGQLAGLADGGIFSKPAAVAGTFEGGALSFTVGGQVTLADDLVPGQYQGVLTVVAQYN